MQLYSNDYNSLFLSIITCHLRHKTLQIRFRESFDYHQQDKQTPVLEKCSTPYSHALTMNILLDKAATSIYPTCSEIPKHATATLSFWLIPQS